MKQYLISEDELSEWLEYLNDTGSIDLIEPQIKNIIANFLKPKKFTESISEITLAVGKLKQTWSGCYVIGSINFNVYDDIICRRMIDKKGKYATLKLWVDNEQ